MLALVFAGQGVQHAGMLGWLDNDLAAKPVLDALASMLGEDWRAHCADPAWAFRNEVAQPLITGLSLAAWAALAPRLPPPALVAGYSVGEMAAFSAAGVFDARCALELVRERARAMDRCALQTPGGLLAVTGLDSPAIDALCSDAGAMVAIRNGAYSMVLGGPNAALERAELKATRQGARVTRLCVGIASHTPWMRAAAEDFARTLANAPLSRPRAVLFSNAADRILDASQARHALAAQIARTVRWDDCMENIHARGPSCVLEMGPGQALARMWNQRYPEIPARSCDDFRSTSTITEWIARLASF
jgi:[acyl-carrier-protein] S-malonyltransferase